MPLNWDQAQAEATELLTSLVQADTTNPPGQESRAVEVLCAYFDANSIPYETFEPQEGRGSLVASWGPEEAPPLYLVSHLDVVPADPEEWQEPPFSGKIVDQELWGRGSLDTKQITAMHAVTLALLKRHDTLKGLRIVFMATADEEKGSRWGMQHLLLEQPQLFSPGYALNEGGGFTAEINGKRYYLLESAQKGTGTLKLRSQREVRAHAACPPERTPLREIVEAVDRLYQYESPLYLGETNRALFHGLAGAWDLNPSDLEGTPQQQRALVSRIIASCSDEALTPVLKSAAFNTFSPNLFTGGTAANQLPHSAEAAISCRVLPEVSRDALEKEVSELLGGLDVEVEWENFEPGYDLGVVEDAFFASMQAVIKEMDPQGEVLPFVAIGRTDSRWLKTKDIRSYGFAPMPGVSIEEIVSRVHRYDERIPLCSLAFGLRATYHIVERLGR